MAIAQDAETGAAVGSAAGPYGAAIGAGVGVVGGLIGSAQSLPTVNMAALLSTINSAGQYQQQIINSLPQEVQANLAKYVQQQQAGGAQYQSNISGLNQDYLSKVAGLYGPNSEAAIAQKTANTQAAYAAVPGTQDAIREALASTGGLSRGNAGAALANPIIAAAQQSGQANMQVNATQTAQGQQATQQALSTVNTMDANMFQQLFGMSQTQATQILQSGNQALQTQLAALINQSQTQTGQLVSAEGVSADNGYQNAVERNQQQGQIYNGLVGLGVNGIQAGLSSGSNSGLPAGADVTSQYYQNNAAANSPL